MLFSNVLTGAGDSINVIELEVLLVENCDQLNSCFLLVRLADQQSAGNNN